MKLAKGGFTDGAKAVDVLTTAINAYGLEASDAIFVVFFVLHFVLHSSTKCCKTE